MTGLTEEDLDIRRRARELDPGPRRMRPPFLRLDVDPPCLRHRAASLAPSARRPGRPRTRAGAITAPTPWAEG